MVLAALLRAGLVVLVPFGDNQRYDLVIDDGGRFYRVQCKTAHLSRAGREGTILFDTCSSQAHRGKGRQGYRGQIELFGVYSPDLDRCFLVPVGDVGGVEATLRLRDVTKPGPRPKLAEDYALETMVKKLGC